MVLDTMARPSGSIVSTGRSEQFIAVLESQEDLVLNKFIDAELLLGVRNGIRPTIEELSHEKADEFWGIVRQVFESHRDNIFSCESNPQEPGNTSTDHALQNRAKGLLFVSAIVKKMQEVISKPDHHVPQSMVEIMSSLQTFLIPSNVEIEPKLKNEIVCLIELWWKSQPETKASMILLAFTFLLEKTSTEVLKVQSWDIKRVWKFRESLLKLKLDSVGCEGLLRTLSQLPENKHYLKSKQGNNFIAFLFTISDVLATNLHEAVKRVLPTAKKSDAEAYGLIYTTAWVKASPEMRTVIEEVCVQNFMLHIFTIQRNGQEMSRLGQHLYTILGHFHHYPTRPTVHLPMWKMLTDLYEPLLWRFLSSSNNIHRCNAAQVFFSAYPLRCSVAGAQARDMYEEKQHAAIGRLLTDSCHIVRIIAVKAVFNVMKQYWQSLPPECIQKWMKIISSDLVGDSSCSDVRRHVFDGFTHLLDNLHCHDYVKELVPNLRLQIHDVNEKVRLAFINLLIKVKDCEMNYWTFVPLRHLAARLEVEDQLVGTQIVKLIFDSFYGSHKTVDQKIRRLMSLFILNQGAGRNFFYYSRPTMCTADAVDLITIILQSLKLFVKTCVEQDKTLDNSTCSITDSRSRTNMKRGRVEDKENAGADNDPASNSKKNRNAVSLENPVVLHGFFDTVGILWSIHIKDLTKEQTQHLQEKCSECMPSFMSFFKGSEFYSSVLFLASLTPLKVHAQNFHISSTFLSQVKKLTLEDDEDAFIALVQPLCSWDRGGDLVELARESLVGALHSDHASLRMTRSRNRVSFRMPQEMKPETALRLLNAVFGYQPNQKKLLLKNYDQLRELWNEMSHIKEVVEARVLQQAPLENPLLNDVFLQGCLLRYAKLIPILMKDGSDFNCCQEYMLLVDWAKETLIPQVALELPSTSSAAVVPLVVAMLRDINCVAFHMLLSGIDDPRFCMRVAAYSKALTYTGCGLMFVYCVSRVTGQLLEMCKTPSEVKDPMRLLRVVIPSLVTAVLSVFQQHNYPLNYISAHVEHFDYVKTLMTDVLVTVQRFYGYSSKLLECIIEKFADVVISVYTLFLRETEKTETANNVKGLPYIASQLVAIFYSNPSLKKVLIKILEDRKTSLSEDEVAFKAVGSLVQILNIVPTRK